jgi:hypothetical protein
MKKKISVIIVVAFSFFFKASAVNSADWQYYDTARNGSSFFYDRGNVTNSDGVLKIYQKEAYHENALFRLRERLGAKYSDLTGVINFLEIDCPNERARIRSVTYYDSDEKAIETKDKGGADWTSVSQKSELSRLCELCCPADWKYAASSKNDDYLLNTDRMESNNSTVTFWIKAVDKVTKKEAEKDKFSVRCKTGEFALRYHIKYKPDGSVSKVNLYEPYPTWSKIPPNTIISLFQNVMCSEGQPRQDPNAYLSSKAHN